MMGKECVTYVLTSDYKNVMETHFLHRSKPVVPAL